jgi:hypothetical protein
MHLASPKLKEKSINWNLSDIISGSSYVRQLSVIEHYLKAKKRAFGAGGRVKVHYRGNVRGALITIFAQPFFFAPDEFLGIQSIGYCIYSTDWVQKPMLCRSA